MHGCALNTTVVFGSDPLNGLLYNVDTVEGKMGYKKKGVVFEVIDHLIKWVLTPYRYVVVHDILYDNSHSHVEHIIWWNKCNKI